MRPDQPALDRAEAALRSGEIGQAKCILAEHPNAAGCADRLRDLLVTCGQLDQALALAEQRRTSVDQALAAHVAGDFGRAAALCDDALASRPDDPGALLHRARAVHNLGRAGEALATLDKLTGVAPQFAEGWYALAHARRAGGDLPSAIEAYERALALCPGLDAARFNLGLTYLNADRPERALACFQKLMKNDEGNVEALVHAGLAQQILGRAAAAQQLFEHALSIAPEHTQAHRFLGALFNQAGRAGEAREHLERALASQPDDPDLLADLADVYELSNQLDRVATTVERGLSIEPQNPRLRIARARLDRRRGDCRQAANGLRRIDPNRLPPRLAMQHFHEYGLALDRLDEANSAMQAFETANRIAAGDPRAREVDGEAFLERVARIRRWLEQQHEKGTSDHPAGADPGADLCFLIGFPRSGTTLIDTIVDAHDGVFGIEEQPTLEPVIEWLDEQPEGYPRALDRLGAAELETLRRTYRKRVAERTGEHSPALVVDKMPLRLLDTALIRRLFPAARLLFVQRHPCDVVLSNFMQLFEPTPAFVNCYTLSDTVRFYDAVMSVWPLLEPLAGDALHTVCYESLVADPDRILGAVCDHLGIDWDPAMLDPHRRLRDRGRVRTASYQQVDESIYNRASGRWKRYREQLAPYLQTLAPHAQRMGYEIPGVCQRDRGAGQ